MRRNERVPSFFQAGVLLMFIVLLPLQAEARSKQEILLVFPFVNEDRRPEDDWFAEYLAEGITRSLKTSRNFYTIDGLGRRMLFQREGLVYPQGVGLATALYLARQVGATWMVHGRYQSTGEGQYEIKFRLLRVDPPYRPAPTERVIWNAKASVRSLQSIAGIIQARLQRHGIDTVLNPQPWFEAGINQIRLLMEIETIPDANERWLRLERLIAQNPDVSLWRYAQLRLAVEKEDAGGVIGEALDRWLSESAEPALFTRPDDRFLLGYWHILNQRWRSALEIFLDLATNTFLPSVYNAIGVSLARLGQNQDAGYYFSRMSDGPAAIIGRWNQAVLELKNGSMVKAHHSIQWLWQRFPQPSVLSLAIRLKEQSGSTGSRGILITMLQELFGSADVEAYDHDFILVFPLIPVWETFMDRLRPEAGEVELYTLEDYRARAVRSFFERLESRPEEALSWVMTLAWLDPSSFPEHLYRVWLKWPYYCYDWNIPDLSVLVQALCCVPFVLSP